MLLLLWTWVLVTIMTLFVMRVMKIIVVMMKFEAWLYLVAVVY